MIQVNKLLNSDKRNWVNFSNCQELSSIYQTYLMYEFYQSVKNYKPFIFISKNQDDRIEGVLLAVLIKESSGIYGYLSSRVLVFGGPIIDQNISNKLNILDELLSELVKKLKHKSIFIQFRNFFEWNNDEKNIFSMYGFSFRERQNILLDLQDNKFVLQNMSESKRRQIRLARKNGSVIRPPQNIAEVKGFYLILKDLYKNQIRKPLPNFMFFEKFYNNTKKGIGIIRLIVVNDKIIGGVLAPVTTNSTIYYWYVAGLDKEYKDNYPSVLAVWSLIEYGLENGIKQLDFMGIGKHNQNYGVREFKMRFSKNIIDYGRFGRRNNQLLYSIAEFGYNLLRSISRV